MTMLVADLLEPVRCKKHVRQGDTFTVGVVGIGGVPPFGRLQKFIDAENGHLRPANRPPVGSAEGNCAKHDTPCAYEAAAFH